MYQRYDEVVLPHTCRTLAELAYGQELVAGLKEDPLVGEDVAAKLRYVPTTTREASDTEGRITDLIRSGALSRHLGVPELDSETDRVMLCGSMAFNVELKELLEARGFTEGSNNAPADFVLEKAFVG